MTVTEAKPEPGEEKPTPRGISKQSRRVRRALGRLGIAAAVGTTAMVTVLFWPVTFIPVSVFLVAATLAVEAMRLG